VKKFISRNLGLLVFVAVLCGGLIHTPTGSAQTNEGFNLVTSPLPINLQAAPGTTVSADIKVKNGATKTEKLKVSLMKFSAYGEEGKPSLQDRAEGDDYFDWVSFTPEIFDAPPNEWITVKMTIKLPLNSAFGYYYAAVFSRANAVKPSSTKENVLVGSTAVLVLVDAKVPGAKRTANISSFKASKRFYEFLPADFTAKIHNSGNVHLVPTGNIFITRGRKAVATLSMNSAAGNVLPNSNRIFSSAWKDGFPVYETKINNGKVVLDSNDKPAYSLKWDLTKITKLKFGRYTAHLVMAYDNGTRDVPLEATVSFWVVPIRVIILTIVVLVIPISLVVYLVIKNRRLKKALKKQ